MSLRIVYLDDEVALCEIFRDIFASNEIETLVFTDPEEAYVEINRQAPDLVFLDLRLGKTTGQEFAKRLDPKIPKVLVTADLSFKQDGQFIRVLHKPYDLEELQKYLESYL